MRFVLQPFLRLRDALRGARNGAGGSSAQTTSTDRGLRVHTDRSLWRLQDYLPWPLRRLIRVTAIDRYVVAEILQPLLVALLFFTTLFISLAMKEVIGDLLAKGVDPLRIFTFLGHLVLEKTGMTLPIACLLAGILAAGRLSGDSEIAAMRAAGISFPRIYVNFLFMGVIAMVAMAVLLWYVAPSSAKAREDFQNWLKTYHSLTMVQTGRFLGRGGFDGVNTTGQDIYAEARDGNVLENVQIREWFTNLQEESANPVYIGGVQIPMGNGFLTRVVHAESGQLLTRLNEEGQQEKFIRLKDGYTVELDIAEYAYQMTDFSGGFMDYVIPPPPKPMGRLDVRPDNFTLPELLAKIHELDNGGMKINPLTILGGLAEQGGLRDYGGLTGMAGGDSGIELPEFELPSIERMEQIQLEVQLHMAGMGPLPKELSDLPEDMRGQIGIMISSFLSDAKKTRRKFAYEVQNRLATPVACMLFFFISFPLGLVVKRSGKGMSFTLALVVFVGYYGLVNVTAQQAATGAMGPAVAAWAPVLILFAFGLHIMGSRTESFNPIAFLFAPLRWLFALLLRPLAWLVRPGSRGGRWLEAMRGSRPVRGLARLGRWSVDAARGLPEGIGRLWSRLRRRDSGGGA